MLFSETKLATITGNFSQKKKKVPLALLTGSFSVERCYSTKPATPATTCEHKGRVRSRYFLSHLCGELRESVFKNESAQISCCCAASATNGECVPVGVGEQGLRKAPEQIPIRKGWSGEAQERRSGIES